MPITAARHEAAPLREGRAIGTERRSIYAHFAVDGVIVHDEAIE